jgi:hypothetical protein
MKTANQLTLHPAENNFVSTWKQKPDLRSSRKKSPNPRKSPLHRNGQRAVFVHDPKGATRANISIDHRAVANTRR